MLLEHTPQLLDYLDPNTRWRHEYDCTFLHHACASYDMSYEYRVEVVRILLNAYTERARQQGVEVPFHDLYWTRRDPTGVSPESFALHVARERGYTAIESMLREAGVPPPPDMNAMADLVRAQPASGRPVITPARISEALALFGGNWPMAWGYLVGKLGLQDQPPPGGWASMDPGNVIARAMRERMHIEAQVKEYRSQLLFAEAERLRDRLQLEQQQLKQRAGEVHCNISNSTSLV